MEVRRIWPRLIAAATSIALVAAAVPAYAAEQTVNLASNGRYVSHRLPANTREVELVRQTAGACRFNRTWGYDLSNRDLWVNGGCAGAFRVISHEPPAAAAAPESSNAGAALAADRNNDDRLSQAEVADFDAKIDERVAGAEASANARRAKKN